MSIADATRRQVGGSNSAAFRSLATYIAAALLPLVAILMLVRPWQSGWSVPLMYSSDSLLSAAIVKGLLQNGWWLTNPSLGAPGVMNLYEMPGADTLSLVVFRLLGLLGLDWARAINVFYLLGYPMAGLATAVVFRRLGFSRLIAVCGALIYALLPYHWMRGEAHLFLSLYWSVPLLALVAFWMFSEHVPLLGVADGQGARPWMLRSRRSIAALAICVFGAGTGVYYAFFGAAFIVFASVRAAILNKERRIALAGLALALLMALVAVAQVAPNFVRVSQEGPNPAGLSRSPGGAEVYGLKITQLFLPIDDHRIAVFARIKAMYREGLRQMGPYLDNEANMAALGVLGAMGFLISMLVFVFGRRPARPSPGDDSGTIGLVETAGFLNLCALLLATVGGFGAMIAVVLPQIRGYNRISVFIAFFSLVALAALAQRALSRSSGRVAKVLFAGALVVLTALVVADQTPSTLAVPQEQVAVYRSDDAFAKRLSESLPKGAAVLQLPYMPFPEPGGSSFGMQDYDPLRGYLHAEGLRWSYGAMKGRADDAWQKRTAGLAPAALVAEARSRGFSAVWVQLNGYEDQGTAMRESLNDLLGQPLVRSGDGVFAVWRL
ncbi:MAG: hypothetical protein CVT67_01800 [Actinobacteria bacterium HGW-Actinobacteria-7]|nr:MAG: hypothetical protein CVT67_01800 [Actinobacteria bacterium HGW-Actinobacteria-7]